MSIQAIVAVAQLETVETEEKAESGTWHPVHVMSVPFPFPDPETKRSLVETKEQP